MLGVREPQKSDIWRQRKMDCLCDLVQHLNLSIQMALAVKKQLAKFDAEGADFEVAADRDVVEYSGEIGVGE
jgi:hypothetical protein